MDNKSVKIGKVVKTKEGKKTIVLGQEGSKDPKYDYTVHIKVLDSQGNEVARVKNPWVNLNRPHENAPESILNELVIWVPNE